MVGNPLVNSILRSAHENKDKIALREIGGKDISYGKFAEKVEVLQGNLAHIGFQPGERMLFLVRPGIDSLIMALSILALGGSAVFADPGMGRDVFLGRMDLAKPRWVFADAKLLILQRVGIVRAILRSFGVELPDVPRLKGCLITTGKTRLFEDVTTYGQLLQSQKNVLKKAFIDPNAEAALVFTSGTTDLPKGIVHTVSSIESTCGLIADEFDLQKEDVLFSDQFFLVLPALARGAEVIFSTERKFLAHTLIKWLYEYRVTKLFGIPYEFQKVAEECRRKGIKLPPSLKAIALGAAPVNKGFLKEFKKILSAQTKVFSVYGMSEILPIAVASLEEKITFQGRGDLLGRTLPGIHVRIEKGEIIVRGPNLFAQYLGSAPTEEHRTGDMGSLLPDGSLVLLGRKKEMIIKGAHNIYPSIFESTIREIEGVKNCALVGLYNEVIQDEEIVLVVEKEGDISERELMRSLRKQLVSGPFSIDTYAQPDEIIFAKLPFGGRSWKLDRKALRAQVVHRPGL